MPLLEVSQTKNVSASIHLTESTATQLDQYAAFIHTDADKVIEHALVHVFSKDREFQEYRKSPQAAEVSPTLRVRKPARPSQPASPSKPVVAASSPANGGAHSSEARA